MEKIRSAFTTLRPEVFWPPFALLILALLVSILFPEDFVSWMNAANSWVLQNFDGAFSIVTSAMVICCLIVFFTPLRHVKIGGPDAQPILSKWQWFSIILCTTVATGILFWGTAEPLYHFEKPPGFVGAEAESEMAARFSISTLFLHWSFTPYAIYAIPALCFAYGFYNLKKPFTLQTTLLFKTNRPKLGSLVDAICLYALALGMAASLGAGILTLSGGMAYLAEIPNTVIVLGFTTLFIVFAFILSAVSGLLKGIKYLSSINAILFFILAIFTFSFGPIKEIISTTINGVKDYLFYFPEMSLLGASGVAPEWSQSWTSFYWANWMAWAPVSALFLGRISRGYTIQQFMVFNWIIPSLFAIIWMGIFGGTSISLQRSGQANLLDALHTEGPESVLYRILEVFPLATLMIPLFLLAIYLSFVTAADSNTEAMSALSQKKDIHDVQVKTPTLVKIIWGTTIGLVSFTMINFAGIDGIKQLSNLGGLPILLFMVAVMIRYLGLIKNSFQRKQSER